MADYKVFSLWVDFTDPPRSELVYEGGDFADAVVKAEAAAALGHRRRLYAGYVGGRPTAVPHHVAACSDVPERRSWYGATP